MNILHIYGQEIWHDDACIAATRETLEKLSMAIDRALSNGRGEMQAFVNDGEGYDVHIVLMSEEQANAMPEPYFGEMARALQVNERLAMMLKDAP